MLGCYIWFIIPENIAIVCVFLCPKKISYLPDQLHDITSKYTLRRNSVKSRNQKSKQTDSNEPRSGCRGVRIQVQNKIKCAWSDSWSLAKGKERETVKKRERERENINCDPLLTIIKQLLNIKWRDLLLLLGRCLLLRLLARVVAVTAGLLRVWVVLV